MSLTSRTLDVINRLFSQVLTQTQSLVAHIHFTISILYPFFTSVDPRYPCNLPSLTHTHACICTHACTCVDTYMCTPRQMGDLWEVSLVSIGKKYNTWQTHTRGFHPTDPYERVSIRVTTSQRDPILQAVHTCMSTRVHTHHTCLHICELVRYSSIWRIE